MRTARLLTVSRSAGGSVWPVGCLASRGAAQGGVWPVGCLPRGCLPRGCLPGVVSARGCIPAFLWAVISLWTEFLSHACENITFSQLLLRAAKIFIVTVKGLKPATSCVRGQDAKTVPARHIWETRSLKWLQFSYLLDSLNLPNWLNFPSI